MDSTQDPDKGEHSYLCPGCRHESVYGHRVSEALGLRAALDEARKTNPKACYYLACPYCQQYIPERYSGATTWLANHMLPGGEAPCLVHQKWQPFYRFIDPMNEVPAEVELGLEPLDALAWLENE